MMTEHTISTIDYSATASLERGKECLREEKYSEAAGLLSLALVGDPQCAEAYRLRAEAFFKLEEYQKSYDDAARALSLVPEDPVALFRRATVLSMHGHPEESLADLDQLLKLEHDHIEGRLRRFAVFMQLGQRHAADEDLRNVLILIPGETPVQFLATHYCMQAGRADAARTLLSSILTREPDNIEALKLRGMVWRHLGAADLAVDDFSHAIDLAGDDAALYVERAVSLIQQGKLTLTKTAYRWAIEDLTKILDEMSSQLPNPAVVYHQRAAAWSLFASRCWFDKSGYQKALDDYGSALASDPKSVDAYHQRALLQWKLGRVDEVIEDCGETIRLKPDHVDALHLRAEAYLRKKEHDKAEADFQAVDRIQAVQAEQQEKQLGENRHACDSLDCSRFCRC